MKKLNLGSHNKKAKGYINVDVLDLPNVDVVHNLIEYPYPFEDNSIDEIVMIEVLEHISFRETHNVLRECYRILKDGARLHIQVPDCASMMRAYINDRISEEVPHKGEKEFILKCQEHSNCVVNPNRWLFAFTGAQKHEYDIHRNMFTPEGLQEDCAKAGFKTELKEDELQWKIKINCYKK